VTDFEFPTAPAGRPLWLITLADLALLLVGFFVLVQATQHVDRRALADGFRAGFGAEAQTEQAIPVAAAGMMNFARGSATLPGSANGLIAWARAVAAVLVSAVPAGRMLVTTTNHAGPRAAMVNQAFAGAKPETDR
jgi:hypothetical protein